MKKLICIVILVISISSCTTRSSSKFSGVPGSTFKSDVFLTEKESIQEPFETLGAIHAGVKNNMLFFPNPKKSQVDQALIEKARMIGADAVINLEYSGGIGFTTWGYMKATGIAVKYLKKN